jgi:predicted transcriptional regulator
MIALNFIDKELIALTGEETAGQGLGLMRKMGVTELPVLEGILYKGMISETELKNTVDQNTPVANIPLQIFESVEKQCHFFEIWSRLVEAHLSCIAVVNEENEYLGCIRQQNLVQFYKQSFALTEPGCIIVLSQRKIDYSLAKIAALVEEHDSVILSSFVTETSDLENILITIKLNRVESELIVKSLQRYDIEIVDVFSEENFSDILKDRFNMLMSYLNV